MTRPHVLLYNDDDNVEGGSDLDRLAVQDVLEFLEPVSDALRKFGPVAIVKTGLGDPEELARELKRLDPRCVFNLAEAARGVAAFEGCVAGLLELLGLPYTGNTPQTLLLCLDKPKTKLLLKGAGIPVVPGVVVCDAERDSLEGLEYPVIVKPACMDASHGIDDSNVVTDEALARAKAKELIGRFPPSVLIENYVDGNDALVALIQEQAGARPTVLPLGTIDFQIAAGRPRVSTFASKWEVGTEYFEKTIGVYPAPFSPKLARRIAEVSVAAFEALGCRDYARVDVRIDWDENPYILEVNPNPCMTPGVGIARAAGLAGWTYEALVQRFVKNAEERGPLSPLPRSR